MKWQPSFTPLEVLESEYLCVSFCVCFDLTIYSLSFFFFLQRPKGVMTSFGAMLNATKGIVHLHNINDKDRYLSYLPVAHGMERWLGEVRTCSIIWGGGMKSDSGILSKKSLWHSLKKIFSFFIVKVVQFYTGGNLFFAESLKTFVADLNRCQPTLFMSVPRLWTKFQAGIFTKMPEKKLDLFLKIPLLNILVKRKILKGLGLNNCRLAGSGSAPIPAELLNWYRRLGLELLEGYGMTENFNYSHISRKNHARAGYVGSPYDDVEQRIAKDGELQVKTPGAMMGYFKNEESTKEAITEDGWVRTGDKGALDEEGRLKITGRTKEIFKTSKGKYVAPAPIENEFVANHLVELCCVSGRGHPQPHAIIKLSEGPMEKAATTEGRTKIGEELEAHLKAVNSKFDAHERLDFIVLVKDDWLPENGFLTPTQKIKRSFIEETYGGKVDGWYEEKKKVIWSGW